MKHRVFKLNNSNSKNDVIVWIPTLHKLYVIRSELIDKVPSVIEDDKVLDAENQSKYIYSFSSCTLVLTNYCNLSCMYCYENKDFLKLQNMEERIAFAAIEYVTYWASLFKRSSIVSFFGGEPTLCWPLLRKSVSYLKQKSKEKGCDYSTRITTNGCVSENKAKWLAENMDSISISMDGYREIHNMQRCNSFDSVYRTAKIVYRLAPRKIGFRTTITRRSVFYLPKITLFFAKEFPGCIINFEPVDPSTRQNFKDLVPDSSLFFDKFIESIPIAAKFGSKIRTSVSMMGSASNRFCGVGSSNFMILPDGKITSCNRMIGDDPISCIFNYGYFNKSKGKFIFDNKKYWFLKELTVNNLSRCDNCFAKFSCRGGCPATKAIIYPERFEKQVSPYCKEIKEFTKKLLEYIVNNGTSGLVIK